MTFARYDWSSGGAIYGIARQHRFRGTKSPIPGIYLAGAGNMGPGVEAVMIAGAWTAAAIKPGVLAKAAEPGTGSVSNFAGALANSAGVA
jgi:all-trans-retinol 13,14-reductase